MACAIPYPARNSCSPTQPVGTTASWSSGRTTWPPPKTSAPERYIEWISGITPPSVARESGPSPSRSTANAARDATATIRLDRNALVSAGGRAVERSATTPTAPPKRIAAACPPNPAQASATTAATTAIASRRPDGASVRRIASTASATTGAATSSSPWIQPAEPTSAAPTSRARAVITTAEGSVKPSHAAAPPRRPARWAPIAIPSWLDDGPGSRLVTATSSENCRSSTHALRPTYSSLKYPMCATGPPNDVSPRRRATAKTSRGPPRPVSPASLPASRAARPAPRARSPPVPGRTGDRTGDSGTRRRAARGRAPPRRATRPARRAGRACDATWRRAAASVPPGSTKLRNSGSSALNRSQSCSRRSTIDCSTRRRPSTPAGTERSAPRSKSSFCTRAMTPRSSSGSCPARTIPSAALSSSTAPNASMRPSSFETRDPSPSDVSPASPPRV